MFIHHVTLAEINDSSPTLVFPPPIPAAGRSYHVFFAPSSICPAFQSEQRQLFIFRKQWMTHDNGYE
jgi:hypothetical protein